MALQRLTEVKKKSNEPKDSRFEDDLKSEHIRDHRRPKKKESGTRLRGH